MGRCRRRQWEDLPGELLEEIVKKNESSDVARVRLVCKSWYSSIPSTNFFLSSSLLNIPYPFNNKDGYNYKFDALETIVVALYPISTSTTSHCGNGGGILKLKQKRSGNLCALNPFEYNEHVSDRDTTISEVVDLTDYQVKVLHRCYLTGDIYRWHRSASMRKVVVCGNRIGAILYDRDDHADEAASDLNFFKLGDEQWTKHKGNFVDMIVFKDKFYAVDHEGLLVMIDPLSLEISQIVASVVQGNINMAEYDSKLLLESSGFLFLVLQYQFRESNLRVYKLDEGVQGRWSHVTNLDDQIFFVGDPECMFSISAKDFPPGVCKKWNCVYLSDRYGEYNNKVQVHRGLSTMHQRLYSFEHCSYQPALADCSDAMNIFWDLKPRKKIKIRKQVSKKLKSYQRNV